jgi:hypothetical protein
MGLALRMTGFVVVILVIGAAPATAQLPNSPVTMPAPPPPSFAQLRFGRVTFTPTFGVTQVGIDTNVLDLNGTANLPPDFTATLRSLFDVRFAGSTLDLRANTEVDYVYYHRYSSERALNPIIHLSAERRFSNRVAAYAQGDFGFTKERTGFELDARTRQLSKSVLIGGRLHESKFTFDLHGSESSVAYDQNVAFEGVFLATTLNQVTQAITASAGYRLTPYTTVLLTAIASSDRFQNSPERDFGSWQEFLSLQFNPRALISGTIGAGYRTTTVLSGAAPNFSGFTPTGSLSCTLFHSTSLTVGGSRDIAASYAPNQPYFVIRQYQGAVHQALFARFDVGVAAAQQFLSYRSFTGTAFDPSAINQSDQQLRSYVATIGVSTHGFRVGVYGARLQRLDGPQSNISDRFGIQISRGRVSLGDTGVFLSGLSR